MRYENMSDKMRKATAYQKGLAVRAQRRGDEQARIADARGLGKVPAACGPNIIEAPARGPVQTFTPTAFYPKGSDGYEIKPAGSMGHDALCRADAFSTMIKNAKRAHRGKPSAFKPPFTPAQVAMGRHYSAVFERHASAGIRCSSMEAMGGGSSGDGGYIDAVLRDGDEIKALRRRIGDGTAMAVRRQRPSTRGSKVNITDRDLVDMVCLRDRSITDVLDKHGWSNRGSNIKVLREALCAALDRMMGPHWNGRMQVMRAPDMLVGKAAVKKSIDC